MVHELLDQAVKQQLNLSTANTTTYYAAIRPFVRIRAWVNCLLVPAASQPPLYRLYVARYPTALVSYRLTIQSQID